MRKPLLAGNWKMFKTTAETADFFNTFLPLVADVTDRTVVICPTFLSLRAAVTATEETIVQIGAQNVHFAKEGAYTGEVTAAMIAESGAEFVIIGHSERRQYFNETDESVAKKTVVALEAGLTPIVCVGELLAEREAGRTNDVLQKQFTDGIAPLTPEQFGKIVIAYEPVWAIGTGKTATPEIAADAHAAIRALAQEKYGAELAGQVQILYGGSVKPDNIAGLMAKEDIDGALVGGASLDPQGFAKIVKF